MNELQIKQCKVCGLEFETKNKFKSTCSKPCMSEYQSKLKKASYNKKNIDCNNCNIINEMNDITKKYVDLLNNYTLLEDKFYKKNDDCLRLKKELDIINKIPLIGYIKHIIKRFKYL